MASETSSGAQRDRPGALRLLAVVAFVGAGIAAGLLGSGDALDRLLPQSADAGSDGSGGPPRATLVAAAPLERTTVRETVEAVGTVEAVRAVEIVPMASGRIVEIAFQSGDELEQGALLVQLDDRLQQAQVKQAQATLAEAQQAFDRAGKLQKQNYASEASFEQARANLLRAEAMLEEAENELEDRSVRAPFSGTAGLVEVEIGQRIDTGTKITTIDDLSAVEVTFWVPELYFPRVERGQTALVRSRAFADRTFQGAIGEIDARVSPRSRAFRVRAVVPNDDRALRTGMFMSIALVLEEREAVTVPEEAIISEGDVSYVFALADNAALRREIRTGIWQDGRVEVLEGLDDDASIITSGMQGLTDGAAVRLKEAADATRPAAGRPG